MPEISPHFSQRRRASTTRRSQRFLYAGSRLPQKYIGVLTLRGSYTEAFHAPHLSQISPPSSQSFTGLSAFYLNLITSTDAFP
jgi:hypothetical protein